uniref:Uncharacterized protein n=1 Tax=Gadus morhua TaxID=8049 RepID=A0A8C5CQC8_GADMO
IWIGPFTLSKLKNTFHITGDVKDRPRSGSPDLNPIEHLWDQLGRAVHARVINTTTLADLRQMLVEEWDAIPQQCVIRLVTRMRRRCQAVVAVYGTSTRY